MASTLHADKDLGIKHQELGAGTDGRQTHYKPVTDEEKALDRRVNLKLDFLVISTLALAFTFCGIDKTNIGFVATSSFVKDANLKPDDIPNSLSLFSATYVPLQPVMAILARRVGVSWFIAVQLISWGAVCMAHAAIRSSATLIALRLLLGACEAGFTQIGFYYMSLFYPKFNLAFRMGLFAGTYSVAGAFAGLLAYGLLHVDGRLRGWQVVFLVEGAISILIGIVAVGTLPTSLEKAWFLSAEEKAHAIRRMELDLAGTQEDADASSRHVSRRDIIDVAKDWKKLLTVVCNIASVLPVTAFTTFLPLVIQGMGYEGIDASLMSVPPFVIGVVGLLIFVWASDYFQDRSIPAVIGMILGVIGCIVMATSDGDRLRYGFAHVCLSGIFAGGPLVAVWLAGNTPWKSTRSVVLGVNGWSNLAGVIAGQIYKHKYAPTYRVPLIITMCIMAAGMVGFMFIRFMYVRTNRKRQAIIADWDEQRYLDEATSEVRRGDQRYTFMYGT